MFVTLSCVHGIVLLSTTSVMVVAILIWWNANTISHNFIHRPFFRSRLAGEGYSIYLSLLLGVPQRLWRARHLAHHAEASGRSTDIVGRVWRDPRVWLEAAAVGALWTTMAMTSRHYAAFVYGPGWITGLALCWLQGYYEHASGVTSHYGRVYNLLFFNDGYHAEHHARPHADWEDLPASRGPAARASRWPPVLRWLDALTLDGLERIVVASPALQRFVVERHVAAFQSVLRSAGPVARVAIVGGGLFPRTAIVLRRLLPDATLTIIDFDESHLALARPWLDPGVYVEHRAFVAGDVEDVDLVVVPLAFHGDREALYRCPPAPIVVVHDWIWNARRPGAVVSWLLLKRLNLVRR
jgi:hypothetical protein